MWHINYLVFAKNKILDIIKYGTTMYRNMTSGKIMNKETFYKIVDILRKEKYLYIYPYLSGEPLLHPQY